MVILCANVANFQQVCLACARGNFGWSLKKNKFKAFVELQ